MSNEGGHPAAPSRFCAMVKPHPRGLPQPAAAGAPCPGPGAAARKGAERRVGTAAGDRDADAAAFSAIGVGRARVMNGLAEQRQLTHPRVYLHAGQLAFDGRHGAGSCRLSRARAHRHDR